MHTLGLGVQFLLSQSPSQLLSQYGEQWWFSTMLFCWPFICIFFHFLFFCIPNFQVSEELSHLRQQSRVPVSSATVLRRLEAERDDTQLELRQVTREGGRKGGWGGEWEKVERVKYNKSPPILNETLLLVKCMFRCGWSVRVFGSD